MKRFITACLFCAASLLYVKGEEAISAGEVMRRIDAGEKLTLIDVRPNTVFKAGHIPGAINVPAALAPQKQLPPLGEVVVYDGGLGVETAAQTAVALNEKPGINARVLEGGFASWESLGRSATTKGAGLKPEETPFITYSDLSKVQSDDVVLVDLRKEPKQVRQSADGGEVEAPESLTDLKKEFGKVRGITRSPFDVPQSRQAATGTGSTKPLLVLIDNGDGTAQATARTLKANGITRYVILAGGEPMIARKGRPGSGRAASTIVIKRPPAGSTTTTNR
ncbi:MAG: rhodanese-like domain-containing protein [Limisphaerales bacterium]